MTFTSLIFVFAVLPVTVIINYFIKNIKIRNVFILLVSLFFYVYTTKRYSAYLLLSILVNYLISFVCTKSNNRKIKNLLVVLCILFNFGLLYYFKYLSFTIETLNAIGNISISKPEIVAPLGISFFTFRTVSYMLDKDWEICDQNNNFINFALYISFFPQIISGPITQYNEFEVQLKNRKVNIDNLSEGIKRFIVGMVKKLAIADCISNVVDVTFALDPSVRSASLAWFGIFAYLIQLYYDFSGYSDMAIGVGKMLGFETPENFNYPYMSKGVVEYWSKWHITLGLWLKTYIYTPIITSLRNKNISLKYGYFIATLAVWLFAGIWHGTGWHYLFYGLYYFFFSVLEHIITDYRKNKRKKLGIKKTALPKWQDGLLHLYFLMAIIFGQLLFRVDNMICFKEYALNMFGINTALNNVTSDFYIGEYIIVFILGIVFCFPIIKLLKEKLSIYKDGKLLMVVTPFVYAILMVIALIFVFGSNSSSFIYFQF